MKEPKPVIVRVTIHEYVALPCKEDAPNELYQAEACLICNGAHRFEITNGMLAIVGAEVVTDDSNK